MKTYVYILGFVISLLLFACGGKKEEVSSDEAKKQNDKIAYRKNIKATVDLICYDQYTYEKEKFKGALIGPNIIAAPFKKIQGAYSVRSIHRGKDVQPMMNGYYDYDIPGNLVLMKMSGPPMQHPKLAQKATLNNGLYHLGFRNNKMFKLNLYCDSLIKFKGKDYYRIKGKVPVGVPLFNNKHLIAGITTTINIDGKSVHVMIPVQELQRKIKTLPTKVERLVKLQFKTDKVYPGPEKVNYFRVHTEKGSFDIRLSDKLPEYQKNFIRLASDGYYDSLLVHRVIHKFLIQMGASDTKFAKKDDPVGWKGPGYSLPTIIIPELIHKRGAIAASKLPDYKNPNNRSDGSQFYIVCGRTFTNDELKDIEEQKNFTFSEKGRKVYNTIGGAPYLDRDYTVFGEVIRGMEVVDALSMLPTNKDERPFQDIRINRVQIVMK